MEAGAIIAIVIIAVIIVALVVALPKIRESARLRARERELGQRRERVSAEHREAAEVRDQRADEAERRARLAEQEARLERAEAELHEERAALHEEGLADHELVDDDERDRFAGTSAVADDERALRRDDDLDRDLMDRREDESAALRRRR
jgi:hypothetical protein